MKRIYATYAESRAARNARQNANRSKLINAGLTSKGEPRKRHVRGAGIHYSMRHCVQAPSVPCQSVDEWLAMGNAPEMLPSPSFSRPPVMPYGAGYA